jgi:hypothetical protein
MFNEHGDFNLTLQGDILFVVVTGAWNAETANAYRAAILKTIEPSKGKLWGLISNICEFELCTPECELLIVQLAAECRGKGLKREAVVNKNIESVKLDLFHKHSKNAPSESSRDVFQRRFFATDSEARFWLDNEGYGL